MNRLYLILFGLFINVVSFGVTAAQESDSLMSINASDTMSVEALFDRAAEHYRAREYDQAVSDYQAILSRDLESASVYFNLANASFKNGDLGYAVVYYHRALKLAPGDEDIINNLEFAQAFTSLQMQGVQLNPINTFFQSLVGPYQLTELAWFSTLLFFLLMIALIVRYGLGFNLSLVRIALVLSLLLLIISSLLTSFKYRQDYLVQRAVLIAIDSPVLSGPSGSLDVELQGSPGLVVEILGQSGDYYNVLFENKRRGWIRKDLVAVI